MTPKHCLLGFLVTLFLTGAAETHPAHESLKPQRVHFQSRNFHNVLHWQPGRASASSSSIYFVQYKIYGQRQWKNKEDCWGIPELFCDLTNETSDVQEAYYGRVKTAVAGTHSAWTMTRRFTPWWEKEEFHWLPFGLSSHNNFHATAQKTKMGIDPVAKIGPPGMNITQGNGSLLVILHPPKIPYRNQKGKNVSMENYYELVYRVFIIKNSLEKERKVYEGTHRVVEIEAVTPHTGYCVVAEIYQPMLDRRSQRSEERCVKCP